MDSIESMAQHLATDLADAATVIARRTPGTTSADALGEISIRPADPHALPLTVYGGRGEIPAIAFDSAAGHECYGGLRTADGRLLAPLEELGVLIGAVASGGARLVSSRLGRRYLLLGEESLHPEQSGHTVVKRWEPIQRERSRMFTFLLQPDPERYPVSLFRIPAYRTYRVRSAQRRATGASSATSSAAEAAGSAIAPAPSRSAGASAGRPSSTQRR